MGDSTVTEPRITHEGLPVVSTLLRLGAATIRAAWPLWVPQELGGLYTAPQPMAPSRSCRSRAIVMRSQVRERLLVMTHSSRSHRANFSRLHRLDRPRVDRAVSQIVASSDHVAESQ